MSTRPRPSSASSSGGSRRRRSACPSVRVRGALVWCPKIGHHKTAHRTKTTLAFGVEHRAARAMTAARGRRLAAQMFPLSGPLVVVASSRSRGPLVVVATRSRLVLACAHARRPPTARPPRRSQVPRRRARLGPLRPPARAARALVRWRHRLPPPPVPRRRWRPERPAADGRRDRARRQGGCRRRRRRRHCATGVYLRRRGADPPPLSSRVERVAQGDGSGRVVRRLQGALR